MHKTLIFSVTIFILGLFLGYFYKDYSTNENTVNEQQTVIEPIDYSSNTEGCELKERTNCSTGVICTGISQFKNESKADILMAEYKARGFAIIQAADFIKRTQNNNQESLDNFIQNYRTLSIRHDVTEKLVYVAIGLKCN